jgi:hypothetical protein
MGIASSVELARSFEAEVGKPSMAVRRWVLTLDDNTLQNNPLSEQDVFTHLGLGTWGAAHPSYGALGLRKLNLTERHGDSPYHAEVRGEYSTIDSNELLAPSSRRADWIFEATPGQVPALFYYDGATQKPLVNSAYDYFEGLTTEEGLVTITIKKNFWPLNTNWLGALNHLNNATYMTCATNTLKVIGVSADYTLEWLENTQYQYFAMEAKLQFRQSTHVLQIPDVGWNFIGGGQKRRCMVFDYQNSEWVASPSPMPLSNGAQTAGIPDILQRRVNPQADFQTLFGKPPTDATWPIGGI